MTLAGDGVNTHRSEVGDDVVQTPEPLTDQPPEDRFCDLVLTGGVASGVVYPWAVLELARHYRFKSIGGTSVGAMAAALAAAAEYGRRTGWPHAFEVLRRVPGQLAEETDGRSKLLSLFQPRKAGRRLFSLFVYAVRRQDENAGTSDNRRNDQRRKLGGRGSSPGMGKVVLRALWLFGSTPAAVTAVLLALALAGSLIWWAPLPDWAWTLFGIAAGLAPLAALLCALLCFWWELRDGLIDNHLGLCNGKPLVSWLHEGIQRAAGLAPDARPLSFRDLWCAPAGPASDATQADEDTPAGDRSIDLQMVTTNVSWGRPLRLPLQERATRLYFDPDELAQFFPDVVMRELLAVARPYEPVLVSDPPDPDGTKAARFRALPAADLPIVVAARLSLSFPLLFSAVPLHAVDAENPERATRQLERCWFSDGGLCSNFPVHLFDAAIPRWPTFGMWLGDRSPYRDDKPCWLPRNQDSGRGEMRRRFDLDETKNWPEAKAIGKRGHLGGFLVALALTAKDWGDYTRMRMPHVRNRVARLALFAGEGGLNIAMSRQTMLEMAHEYGTSAGRKFVEHFGGTGPTRPGRQWSEHRWVRLQSLAGGLRELIRDVGGAAAEHAYTTPLDTLIADVIAGRPPAPGTELWTDRPRDKAEAEDYARLLQALRALELALAAPLAGSAYRSDPPVELRLRPLL